MKRLTIFHIDGERGLRGGERQLLYLAAQMRELGHENIVACRWGSPLSREASALGLRRLHLPFRGEWDPVSAWMLRRAASKAAAPVLHAHTAHGAGVASLASRLGGPPWVAHRRVDFKLSSDLSRRLKYGSAGSVVAVSEGVKRVLLEDGLSAPFVEVVNDCVPVGEQEARTAGLAAPLAPAAAAQRALLRASLSSRWGLPLDARWVGTLAAMVPHKDHETLLRAAALVLKERPAMRFILVGEGPLRASLESLAAELGIRDSVVFTGFQDAPGDWLRGLDLYAHSSWGEGMGSVLLEAMACGLPIAATDAGGIPEVVAHGRTGLLCPARDPGALSRSILEALADPGAAHARALAGLEAVRAFGMEAMGRRMLEVYASLLPPEAREAEDAPRARAPGAPPRLSVILITREEALDLPDCLQSLRGLDAEIVAVDGGSTDGTVDILRRAGARVHHREFDGFAPQKQAALDLASGDWVLSIDADERLSPELRSEIDAVVSSPAGPDAYELPFEVHFLGRALRFGGLGSERHLRLFRRSKGRFVGGRLHEGIETEGKAGRLEGKMVHLPYRDIDDYLDKLRAYTTAAALKRRERGRRSSALHHLLPFWELFHRLVLRLGILDGTPGVAWA
ncbi:MAG: glycosyltransferase, partial [Elusimicrobiota bacterium]